MKSQNEKLEKHKNYTCQVLTNSEIINVVLMYLVHFLTPQVNLLPIHIFNNLLFELLPRRRLPSSDQIFRPNLAKWSTKMKSSEASNRKVVPPC